MSPQKSSEFENPGNRNGTRVIRVLLAHDHPVMRIGVGNVLQNDAAVEVVGEADSGDEAIAKALELDPDILLLDSTMAKFPGLEEIISLLGSSSKVKIILLTTAITPVEMIEALQLGVRGIVLKDAITDQLIPSIRSIATGHYWVTGRRAIKLVDALRGLAPEAAPVELTNHGLTPREFDVIRCIVEGCSNRDIAQQFQLSEETVKRHLSNIFDKTGVSTRLELALFAIQHQLVVPQQ